MLRNEAVPQQTVWTGRIPLIGTERLARMLPDPVGAALRLHTYVLISVPDVSDPASNCVWLLDFLPLNPTSPATALMLLTGAAPAETRVRRLPRGLMAGARLVGPAKQDDALAAALEFNR